jgi:hypothetical protein
MKILADENFPRPVIDALRRKSHEVKWARKSCPGLAIALCSTLPKKKAAS